MYLARWILEDPNAAADWRRYGLHPDGWLDLPDGQKINWFNLDFATVASEHRWALLLASYASMLEARRRISCPPQRALHSVLYAALKRGRDYLSETSGATEFFDEVTAVLLQQQLNPIFDSVLENSSLFTPELAMLTREAEAYQREMFAAPAARPSTCRSPRRHRPTSSRTRDFAHQEQRRASDLDAEHLLLADTFRIPTDGIYLRDPECLLFKEWARLDLENSSLGAGFEFTAIAYSGGRPDAPSNKTDYQFSIDPERANGRHLYTVWSRLQTQEVEALRAHEQDVVVVGAPSRRGASQVTSDVGELACRSVDWRAEPVRHRGRHAAARYAYRCRRRAQRLARRPCGRSRAHGTGRIDLLRSLAGRRPPGRRLRLRRVARRSRYRASTIQSQFSPGNSGAARKLFPFCQCSPSIRRAQSPPRISRCRSPKRSGRYFIPRCLARLRPTLLDFMLWSTRAVWECGEIEALPLRRSRISLPAPALRIARHPNCALILPKSCRWHATWIASPLAGRESLTRCQAKRVIPRSNGRPLTSTA